MQTYSFSNINRDQVQKLFQLKKHFKPTQLFIEWAEHAKGFTIDNLEEAILSKQHSKLLKSVESWNEQELYVKFITFLIEVIDFDIYELDIHSFSERVLSKKLTNTTTLQGRVDWMVASGNHEPRQPFFFLHEYKRSLEVSGDPVGQLLASMCVAQLLNNEAKKPTLFEPYPVSYKHLPMYGCYVIGQLWYFVVLKDRDYYISLAYDATKTNELYEIVKLLKAQKQMIIERVTKNQ